MRRLIVSTLLLLATIAGQGCDANSVTDLGQSAIGTYALSTIDGGPTPFILLDGDPKLEVLSDEVTLASNGQFTQTTTFRYTEDGIVTGDSSVELGTYTVSGTRLTFRFSSDNSTAVATLSNDGFAITSNGHTLAYARR